jgi:hypothetical protein
LTCPVRASVTIEEFPASALPGQMAGTRPVRLGPYAAGEETIAASNGKALNILLLRRSGVGIQLGSFASLPVLRKIALSLRP